MNLVASIRSSGTKAQIALVAVVASAAASCGASAGSGGGGDSYQPMPDITANFGLGGDATAGGDGGSADGLGNADAPPGDAVVVHDGGSGEADVSADTTVPHDSGTDTTPADTNVADSAVADTSVADTNLKDTAVEDTTVADTAVADTAVGDTAVADTAVADTGSADTTFEDSNADDTSAPDSAAPDTTIVDTGPVDAGGNGLPAPGVGELVITEILANPLSVSDAAGEWFEVCNVSGKALSLAGVQIGDGNIVADPVKSPPIPVEGGASLTILPSACFVFGLNGDQATNGGVKVDYVYPSKLSLNNSGTETVFLRVGGVTIDEVVYSPSKNGWPAMPNGASYMLPASKTSAVANDDGTAWCMTVGQTFGAGDAGTPGKQNGPCL